MFPFSSETISERHFITFLVGRFRNLSPLPLLSALPLSHASHHVQCTNYGGLYSHHCVAPPTISQTRKEKKGECFVCWFLVVICGYPAQGILILYVYTHIWSRIGKYKNKNGNVTSDKSQLTPKSTVYLSQKKDSNSMLR